MLAGSVGGGLWVACVGLALGCFKLRALEVLHSNTAAVPNAAWMRQRHLGTANSGVRRGRTATPHVWERHSCLCRDEPRRWLPCNTPHWQWRATLAGPRFWGAGGMTHLTQRPTASMAMTPPSAACPTPHGVGHGIWVRDKRVWWQWREFVAVQEVLRGARRQRTTTCNSTLASKACSRLPLRWRGRTVPPHMRERRLWLCGAVRRRW